VGREAELAQLHEGFDRAMSGEGSLVMVVGEPGIGKTSLCDQLATYVALRGGKILAGHCYEEGSLSLPYLAFVEAMRSYVLERDADGGTLDMLSHVARNLSGSRLLIVGTYRDVEVDRTHALSSTLAELRRGSAFGRIPLRGLTVDEVHRQTEGNPLFIQEVLRYLVEEGLIRREAGGWN
jgi:predicted ATPase